MPITPVIGFVVIPEANELPTAGVPHVPSPLKKVATFPFPMIALIGIVVDPNSPVGNVPVRLEAFNDPFKVVPVILPPLIEPDVIIDPEVVTELGEMAPNPSVMTDVGSILDTDAVKPLFGITLMDERPPPLPEPDPASAHTKFPFPVELNTCPGFPFEYIPLIFEGVTP